MSGSSTPLSSSSTLTDTSSPKEKHVSTPTIANSPAISANTSLVTSAAAVIESIASKKSSSVFIYDTALSAGFGSLTQQWSDRREGAKCIEMQSRAGAGLILAGRLSQGTSADGEKGALVTAYLTPDGLAQMAPTLGLMPAPTTKARIIIQVPALASIPPTLALTPSLGALSTTLLSTPENFTVFLSSTVKEAVDLAFLSYKLSNSHVIHVFDNYSSSRELRKINIPDISSQDDYDTLQQALEASGYSFFDYSGDTQAKSVLVVLNDAFGSMVKALAGNLHGVGVITVRVVRPWNRDAFAAILPASTLELYVLTEIATGATSGVLYEDVLGTLIAQKRQVRTREQAISPEKVQQYFANPSTLGSFISSLTPHAAGNNITIGTPNLKKLLFLASSASHFATLPQVIAQSFLTNNAIRTQLLTDYDAFSKAGGISASRLLLSPSTDPEVHAPMDLILPLAGEAGIRNADFVGVLDQSLLKTHHILETARDKASILIVTQWSAGELASNIPSETVEVARANSLLLFCLDAKAAALALLDGIPGDKRGMESVVVHLAFLRLYVGLPCTLGMLEKVGSALFGQVIEGVPVGKVAAKVWESLVQVQLPPRPSVTEVDGAPAPKSLKTFEFNTIDEGFNRGLDGPRDGDTPFLGTWHDAARHILFREAFAPSSEPHSPTEQNPSLRPEVEDRTFLVTCSVNRRLTPHEYDRNVFHLEFDTTGTGLKYAIGEALGIHGWNDEGDVLEFCRSYGVDPSTLITLPVPDSRSGRRFMHTRTVFQALQQQIDIFGRPPKSFYNALADHATSQEDRLALRFIGASEGSSTFKKLSEVDTVNYGDVLSMFPSARPKDFAILCELIGDIKPRHYSIASAQSAVGDRVDLLVVTVDWVTPSGSPRFGQCTRYLAGLKPGQKVTVSIKPSVMKLPPDDMQPIIMAGLGTGAAPFRAFIQHRAHLASQNIPVGPLIYYFGSRHRSQEYLYGEELEAYVADGIVTHIGLAFSRDQKKKIYIQHKMMEDGVMLATMLGNPEGATKGVFYLCGPTWPVPDVYEALVDSLHRFGNMEREDAMEYLEGLKEEERYVLEVY